jgi:hypothetical protein
VDESCRTLQRVDKKCIVWMSLHKSLLCLRARALMSKSPPVDPRAWGEKRAAFLALQDAIVRELATGRSLRAIYAASGAAKVMGYSMFTRYVARYLPLESQIQRRIVAQNPSVPQQSQPTPHQVQSVSPESSKLPLQHLPPARQTELTPQENSNGPKAPPRPRSFVRRGGVADDYKDELI